jgi:hypothetical protein
MASFYCCLLFSVLFPLAVGPQSQPRPAGRQPQTPGQEPAGAGSNLRVDGRVEAQTYCGGGPVPLSVSMKIGLRFTNLSDHRVILAKKIRGPLAIRVAKSPEALRTERFEYNPNIDAAVDELPGPPMLGDTPDSKHFCILAPGKSFETHVSSVIFASQTGEKGLVGKGKHVLQLGLETWPYQWPWYRSIDASKLADQWKKYGQLIRGNIYTEPIPFIIPEKVRVGPCE